jgi:hypothetical protein
LVATRERCDIQFGRRFGAKPNSNSVSCVVIYEAEAGCPKFKDYLDTSLINADEVDFSEIRIEVTAQADAPRINAIDLSAHHNLRWPIRAFY